MLSSCAGWFLWGFRAGFLGHLKVSTRTRYAGIVERHIIPKWGRRKLNAINHADIAEWVADLVASDLSPGTVRYIHRVFALILEHAVLDSRLTANPAKAVSLPKMRLREPVFLTIKEVDRLAECAGDDGITIEFLALTGLRFGEMAALRVADLDLARRRVRVKASVSEVGGKLVWTSPKNHHSRTVPLPASLADRLTELVKGKGRDDLVFTSPAGGVLRINNWRPRMFDRACAAAGIMGLRPHDLRHTAASLAVSAGANVKAVQRMLGHASAAMTLDIYAGLFGDDLDSVAEGIDRLRAAGPTMDHTFPAADTRTDDDDDGLGGVLVPAS
ncbi:MAG TPA: tyrosine-type recombinase/integrase [Streptosporangiaceae bacterium]|jgi:integrase|nr:tyrosine-type recombinase/integrase [Streptosporangiaceae bacterium]